MKVMVTGGAGFIGFHLAKDLSRDNDVVIVDNLSRGQMDPELKELIDKDNVTFMQCDLTDRDAVSKLGKDYDEVYHLAAVNGTKFFYEKPHEVLRINTLAAINMLEWFKDSGSKKFLFASSSETYAGTLTQFGLPIPTPEDVPLCIEDVTNPRWSYGGSKIIGELFSINYARMYKFRMSIVRYHNIYGPRMGHEHVIPEFAKRLIDRENPFKIFGGDETRSFCYVDDAVRATQLAMRSEKTDNEILHIGNQKGEIGIRTLAEKMFDVAGFKPEFDVKPGLKGSVKRRCPSTEKLNRLTGYEPEVSIEEGLKKTYEWYENEV